jgi:alpha-amylase
MKQINFRATFINRTRLVLLFYLVAISVAVVSCSKDPENVPPPPAGESTTPSQEVMIQAFYWDVTEGGIWWNNLNTKLDSWKSEGFTTIWLPPISKGQSGGFSMGYDPYDYFDFGQYEQQGTVETRFGSYTELQSLLSSAKTKGFKLIADIILNHNSGGDLEFNPITNNNTYTKFTPKSGKFNRSYLDFHPNSLHSNDEGSFGNMPDLCHDVDNVKNWLWIRSDGVGKFYKETLGFDGWRFDYVKGFNPNVVKDWNASVGGSFSIGEFWDGNVELVKNWCAAANSGAFDFPLMYAMDNALDGGDMFALDGKGLNAVSPSQAFTFVANHDVDQISTANKLKAYCYILTAEGTPFIFYSDYESVLDKSKLNDLIWIRKNLAAGTTTRLLLSTKEYIFRRNGTPGLVTFINNGNTDMQKKIQTTWANAVLKDYTGANPDVTTDGSGYATIQCKANSYSVYSRK